MLKTFSDHKKSFKGSNDKVLQNLSKYWFKSREIHNFLTFKKSRTLVWQANFRSDVYSL
jgi:hypothetical protein